MPSGPSILHADLDAFYASVEQLLDPTLRGRPVAVGGSDRGGVVLAASYEAKRRGVRTPMPGWRAKQLCPDIVFVGGHFREYQKLADRVMDVLLDISPLLQRISIDEAFLDVTGATHLFGPPDAIGALIRRKVREEIGLPISVGAARTKHLAKVASQVAKPDGLVVVDPAREREFLDPLPVALIWGVGPVAQAKLAERGIRTIGELARTPSDAVQRLLGEKAGAKLTALSVNEDPRKVVTSERARSIGAQSAMGRKPVSPELVRATLAHLAERIGPRMRAKNRMARTVTVRVRFPGMKSVTRSLTLQAPVSATLTLTEIAEQLVWKAIREQDPPATEVTLLAISASNLSYVATVQTELALDPDDPWHPGSPSAVARSALDSSMDTIRERFGRGAVGYLPATINRRGVPDEFRELAEKDL